jgi:TPR repeat protein
MSPSRRTTTMKRALLLASAASGFVLGPIVVRGTPAPPPSPYEVEQANREWLKKHDPTVKAPVTWEQEKAAERKQRQDEQKQYDDADRRDNKARQELKDRQAFEAEQALAKAALQELLVQARTSFAHLQLVIDRANDTTHLTLAMVDTEDALYLLRLWSGRGEVQAMVMLANAYLEGRPWLQRNTAEGIKWLSQAAKAGDRESRLALGKRYYSGDGVPKDWAEAAKWFRLVPSSETNYALGEIYSTGPNKDLAEAAKWYRWAVQQLGDDAWEKLRALSDNGVAEAQYLIGMEWADGKFVRVKLPEEAILYFRKAAEQGHAEAQLRLGSNYEFGEGVAKNPLEAAKWYRKVAEQGNLGAQMALARMYASGDGMAKDPAEAAKWTRMAAEQEDSNDKDRRLLIYRAQYTLGLMCQNGEGLAKDVATAVKWFHKAADIGNAEAMDHLGAMYEDGSGVTQDVVEAITWYRKGAAAGSIDAMNKLGRMYREGNGVVKDSQEAAKWIRQAAEGWDQGAILILGSMYENGEGVPQNMPEAVQWYRKAAARGDADAEKKLIALLPRGTADDLYELAQRYAEGKGVAKDLTEATKWYRQAAESGSIYAESSLAEIYYTGVGTVKDPVEAAKWYHKLAERGDPGALFRLGGMYENGEGVPKDMTVAMQWYRKGFSAWTSSPVDIDNLTATYAKSTTAAQFELGQKWLGSRNIALTLFKKAAEAGHAESQEALGEMNSFLGPPNWTEAVKWYRLAAEKGKVTAQYMLGECYSRGQGVARDLPEAAKWYRKAAEQGHFMAQFYLGAMYEKGDGVAQDTGEAAKWYGRSAEDGTETAKAKFVELYAAWYAKGEGVAEDEAGWFREDLEKAEQGDADSQFRVGQDIAGYKGGIRNPIEVAKWYRKAAEQGHAEAQTALAGMYESGKGVPGDVAEAMKWYRKAAEQGIELAQVSLGHLYEDGKVATRDLVEALAWYQLTVGSELYDSSDECEKLKGRLSPEQVSQAEQRSEALRALIRTNQAKAEAAGQKVASGGN